MFVGQSKHTITKDGRLSLPSKMREVISKKYQSEEVYFVLIQGNILCVYPEEEFEKALDRVAIQDASLSEMAQFERNSCANAESSKIDSSGRIVIPQDMKELAKIDQDVLIIGARTHIELWSPARWEAYQENRPTDVIRKWTGIH